MKKICPRPLAWKRVVERLAEVAAEKGIEEGPPGALILSGWWLSNDVDKKNQWQATIAWAEKHELKSAIDVADHEFYRVTKLDDSPPPGFYWRTKPAPKPDPKLLEKRLATLRAEWNSLPPQEVTAVTRPLRFTGKKSRRLEVLIIEDGVTPPWGTWTSLASGPERETFTRLRNAINKILQPHEVDHVVFV